MCNARHRPLLKLIDIRWEMAAPTNGTRASSLVDGSIFMHAFCLFWREHSVLFCLVSIQTEYERSMRASSFTTDTEPYIQYTLYTSNV